jgi:hypothetical protein
MARTASYAVVLGFSIFVTFLSHQQVGHETYVMASWFVGGWIAFLALGGLVSWRWPGAIQFHPVLVAVCLLPMLGTEPLFENDQYRYFWEGKVLTAGFDPWRVPPAAELLDDVAFPERELVGFNKLTSPYSPLAVAYHAVFSWLPYHSALFMLQLVNLFLTALVFFLLPPLKPIYAVGVAGLLGKEFVQSVHIDLLVWLFLWVALSRMAKGSLKLSAAAFVVSALLKVNTLLVYPWFLCAAYRARRFSGVALWLGALVVALGGNLLGPVSFHESSGLVAFMEHWVWHSGVLALWQTFGGEVSSGIQLANGVWASGIAVLGVLCLRWRFDGLHWSTVVYVFSAFWRPAFNSWYFPWFGLSAAMAGQHLAMWYGLAAPLAYVKYADPSQEWLLAFIITTHLPGAIYLAKQTIVKRTV